MKTRLLAAVVALFGATAAAPTAFASEPADATVRAFIEAYDRAFNAKDLNRLAAFYRPDVTIFEGGSTNDGWPDDRDNHLGPELEEFQNLEFSHFNAKAHPIGQGGHAAYVTAEYRLKARVKDREVDAAGFETLVLVRDDKGAWKIRHSHTSSRQRPPASPTPQK